MGWAFFGPWFKNVRRRRAGLGLGCLLTASVIGMAALDQRNPRIKRRRLFGASVCRYASPKFRAYAFALLALVRAVPIPRFGFLQASLQQTSPLRTFPRSRRPALNLAIKLFVKSRPSRRSSVQLSYTGRSLNARRPWKPRQTPLARAACLLVSYRPLA